MNVTAGSNSASVINTDKGNITNDVSGTYTYNSIEAGTLTLVGVGQATVPSLGFASLASVANGSVLFCDNCKNVVDDSAAGAACLTGGHGAFAKSKTPGGTVTRLASALLCLCLPTELGTDTQAVNLRTKLVIVGVDGRTLVVDEVGGIQGSSNFLEGDRHLGELETVGKVVR